MAEVTFAKAFLTTLDKRPVKLPSDHISDPRKYPNASPFILPKQSHAFPKKDVATLQAQAAKTITVTIKPMRGGEAVTLSGVSLEQSVHDVKVLYAQKASLLADKIKLLLNKKPAADLKTLQDLGAEGDIEMSAMIMGGAAAEATPIASTAASTPGVGSTPTPSDDKMELDSQAAHPGSEKAQVEAQDSADTSVGAGALHTTQFWDDLEGFLAQRLRDSDEASKLTSVFRGAWQSSQ